MAFVNGRAFSLLGLAGAVMVCALPQAARAQGIDQTCVLPLTKFDPALVNVAYPDEGAVYWVGAYVAVPGTHLRITGRYPHARYFSFNVYDNALRPLDALADVEIAPDPGSANPFPTGASRLGAQRDYNAYVDFGPIPPIRAANTLYTGTGQSGLPNFQGTFILRVYVPDQGRDETGGVGLPTVTLEQSVTGSPRPPASPCSGLSKPPAPGVNQVIGQSGGPPVPAQLTLPGLNPPRWTKFKNLVQAGNQLLTGNPFLDAYGTPGPLEAAGGNGAFLSNLHNSYVFSQLNRAYGEVSLTTVRAPTFPDTRPAPATMPTGQLRYFSMCTDETLSQRYVACASDDRSQVGSDGLIRYVVSPAPERPANATAACGYTWLPYGPSTENTLILRHMLPDPPFAQAIQRAQPGAESQTMGDYLPRTRYLASGEALPCLSARGAAPIAGRDAPTHGVPPSSRCRKRRRLVINPSIDGDQRLVSLRVYLNGRRVRTLRRRDLRLGLRITLRDLPLGAFTVTLRGRTSRGTLVRSGRTYRTCPATHLQRDRRLSRVFL